MQKGLVSIVLPTYNGLDYLEKSIKSCLDQTYNNIELIVVDDHSDQNIKQLIDSISDPRIKYIRNNENKGLPESLNIGFANADGQFLTWTSDDNYYAKNAIEILLNYLNNHPDIDFVYSSYYIIDSNEKVIKECISKSPFFLNFKNHVGGCFLFKSIVFQKIGGFYKEYLLAEDYHYWLRVRQNFKMANIKDSLYYYRTHQNSLTGQNKKQKIAKMAYFASKPFVPFYARAWQLIKYLFHKVKNNL
jgi:glycosyltransferase involved in cell wall biosynthesis